MLAHLPMSLWDDLAAQMNVNINQYRDNTSNKRRYARHAVTGEEVLRFYGLLMMLESTWGNDTGNLKAHFAKIKNQLGSDYKIMGLNRFTMLKSSFYGSSLFLKKVSDVFRENTTKHISQVSVVVGDEAVLEYQPSPDSKKAHEHRGDPIPVVFIPRKPHPNGFLLYLLATYVEDPTGEHSGSPHILDIIPHLSAGDTAPVATIKEFLNRWSLAGKKPIVVSQKNSST